MDFDTFDTHNYLWLHKRFQKSPQNVLQFLSVRNVFPVSIRWRVLQDFFGSCLITNNELQPSIIQSQNKFKFFSGMLVECTNPIIILVQAVLCIFHRGILE